MKVLLIALFAAIGVVGVYSKHIHGHNITQEQYERIKAEVDECARVNNAQEVYEIMKTGSDPPRSRNLDCFSACVLKSSSHGVMNADGSINHKPGDSDVGKQCKDLKGTDDCDTAGKIISCLRKNNLLHKIE